MKLFRLFLSSLVLVCAAPASAQISTKEFPRSPDLTVKSPGDVVPENFRGRIVYRGFYRGKAFVPGPAIRDLSLRDILRSAAQAKMLPMAGDYEIAMEFDGPSVSGTLQTTSGIASGEHANLDPGHFTGTRNGATCQLTWNDGQQSAVYCGKSEFRTSVNEDATNPPGAKIAYVANLSAVETTDYVERDRANAIATEKARNEEAARRKAELAQRAALKASLPKGATAQYSPLLNAAVTQDAQSWALHTYKPGSLDLVAAKYDAKYAATYLKAYFRYGDGSESWVGAIVKNKQVVCLLFPDDSQGCRGIGEGIGGKFARSVIGAMMNGGGRGGGECYGGNDACRRALQDEVLSRQEADRNMQQSYGAP